METGYETLFIRQYLRGLLKPYRPLYHQVTTSWCLPNYVCWCSVYCQTLWPLIKAHLTVDCHCTTHQRSQLADIHYDDSLRNSLAPLNGLINFILSVLSYISVEFLERKTIGVDLQCSMSPWWPLWVLFSWCPACDSSHCDSFPELLPTDEYLCNWFENWIPVHLSTGAKESQWLNSLRTIDANMRQ